MNCRKARKILLSKDLDVADADMSAARDHSAGCGECQSIFAQQEGLKSILKTALPDSTAPTTLREKIFAKVAAERARRIAPSRLLPTPEGRQARISWLSRRPLVWTAGTAVFLILLFLGYQTFFLPQRTYASPVVRALAQDHIAHQVRENPLDLRTADTAELERWFRLRVDFAVRIPPLKNLTLIGGRLCVINGERAVSLVFQKETVPITLYIMDQEVVRPSRMRVVDSTGPKGIFHGDAKGCNVIVWQERGLVYSLVSDHLNENELVELVKTS